MRPGDYTLRVHRITAFPPVQLCGGQAARFLKERLLLLFFFQAEDGIRDADVTGVQTCALPISGSFGAGVCRSRARTRCGPNKCLGARDRERAEVPRGAASRTPRRRNLAGRRVRTRSEERREGKRVARGGGGMR